MASAERRPNQERLSRREHMSHFLNGIRTFNETDYTEDPDGRKNQMQAIVGDAMHIVNAHWWQRGRLRRQLNRETKTEPSIKTQADRILALGIEVNAKEAAKRGADFYKAISDRWQKRIMTDFGIAETKPLQEIVVEKSVATPVPGENHGSTSGHENDKNEHAGHSSHDTGHGDHGHGQKAA